MTPVQLIALGALSIIALAMLFSVALLANAFYRYRQQIKNEKSLLARLETAAGQTSTNPDRKKYYMDWSRK